MIYAILYPMFTQAGADLNSRHPQTPLVIATLRGLTECVENLLKARADANIPANDVSFYSWLHLAVLILGTCWYLYYNATVYFFKINAIINAAFVYSILLLTCNMIFIYLYSPFFGIEVTYKILAWWMARFLLLFHFVALLYGRLVANQLNLLQSLEEESLWRYYFLSLHLFQACQTGASKE